jgi:hypothetical protein
MNSPDKQHDLDPIPTWLLQKCMPVLLPTIIKIANLSTPALFSTLSSLPPLNITLPKLSSFLLLTTWSLPLALSKHLVSIFSTYLLLLTHWSLYPPWPSVILVWPHWHRSEVVLSSHSSSATIALPLLCYPSMELLKAKFFSFSVPLPSVNSSLPSQWITTFVLTIHGFPYLSPRLTLFFKPFLTCLLSL